MTVFLCHPATAAELRRELSQREPMPGWPTMPGEVMLSMGGIRIHEVGPVSVQYRFPRSKKRRIKKKWRKRPENFRPWFPIAVGEVLKIDESAFRPVLGGLRMPPPLPARGRRGR